MSLVMAGSAVLFFSLMAFWRPNAVLFMVAAGASMMTGLYWYDVYTTNIGLSISLMLIAYSLLCIGLAFKCIFYRGEITGSGR